MILLHRVWTSSCYVFKLKSHWYFFKLKVTASEPSWFHCKKHFFQVGLCDFCNPGYAVISFSAVLLLHQIWIFFSQCSCSTMFRHHPGASEPSPVTRAIVHFRAFLLAGSSVTHVILGMLWSAFPQSSWRTMFRHHPGAFESSPVTWIIVHFKEHFHKLGLLWAIWCCYVLCVFTQLDSNDGTLMRIWFFCGRQTQSQIPK